MARLREASAPGDLEAVRALFAEYARSVDEPCCFAGFERELAELPRGYRALFIAEEGGVAAGCVGLRDVDRDRKSTRLNSSHQIISYAVFCLKKKRSEILTPWRSAESGTATTSV